MSRSCSTGSNARERPCARSWRAADMRASFYEGAGRFTTGTAPEPRAGAGEAVLKMKRVGICGTDLHIFQGHLDQRVPKRGIIGHETFGEIAEAPGGSGLSAGGRRVVAALPGGGPRRAG